MRGQPVPVPLPHISGSDAAGEVTAVGEDVTNFKVGDRVVSHSNMSCRVCEACTDGREYDCTKRTIWGFQTGPLWGAFSEFTHLPEVNVAKIPEGVSFDEACSSFHDNTYFMAYVSRKSKNSSWSNSPYHGRRILVLEALEFRLQNYTIVMLLLQEVQINWVN